VKGIEPRRAVEKVMDRLYRHHEMRTGRLATGEEQRAMRRKAEGAASRAERKRRG